jgi:nucleoside-diphosphate-sugar epimerase
MSAKQIIFDKKNIVVFGGAGFIGSHLCDELIRTSKVICVDDYSSGNVNNISHLLQNPNFVFLRHDITQPLDLSQFPELEILQVPFQGIQEIYYLACPTIQLGYEDYVVHTAKANSIGVLNALEIARQYHAKFLFGSSRAVYGDPLEGQAQFSEDYWGFVNNLGTRAAYNEGKRFGETLTQSYLQSYQLDTKIARIFNTYGPRMLLNAGRMIPDFVKAAIDNTDVIVYGDGTQTDGYCYVDDLVQGLVALMQSSVNEPVNLGNSDTRQIIDIAKHVIQLANSKSNIVFRPEIQDLVRYAAPDIQNAKRLLGWFPVTDLDTGLERTVADMIGAQTLTYQSFMQKS